jgi:biopolymer transport protein ExbB
MAKIQNYRLVSIVFFVCSCTVFAQPSESGSAGTFFQQFFVDGGAIVWFVLLPMSIMTVYLAVDLMVTIRRSRLLPPGLSNEIATHAMRHGVNSLFARLAGQTDLVSRSVLRSIDQRRQLGGSVESARHYAAEALQERGLQLMRKTQWCQIIGSVAPMVGLFGTVFGMIKAFNLLGQGTEGPRYELLADAISVALVTTFWGLLVGIPALFFYGMFQTRIEAFISEAAIETDSLLGRIFEDPTDGSNRARPLGGTADKLPSSESLS